MAPKKQVPPGPRPKRLTRTTAKLTSPINKSPDNVDTITTLQSASDVVALQAESAPIISTEATSAKIGGGTIQKQGSCSIEMKQMERINCAGNETLALDEKNNNNKNVIPEIKPRGIDAVEEVEVKPKRKKKVIVKKIVKKLVKKRVPKSMIKELTTKEEVFNDNDDDDIDDKNSSEGALEDDKGLEKQTECLDSQPSNASMLQVEGEEEQVGNFKVENCDIGVPLFVEEAVSIPQVSIMSEIPPNEGLVLHSDSGATQMPMDQVVNAELVRDLDNEGVLVKSVSVTEIPLAAVDNRPLVQVQVRKSDSSSTELPMPLIHSELVEDTSNEGQVQKSDSTTEFPVEVVNSELVIEAQVPNFDSATELSLEVVNADLINDSKVPNSDSASDITREVVNTDLVGDRINEGVVQLVDSCSGYEEGGKEDSEMGNGRIALSGELEALERRRRRRTEIFIGGLNPDAKEEDVRKVFEQVGQIVELRLAINGKTGKNKRFAFVRYASAADAKKALDKYAKVEICGKQCAVAPVEGNDTIFLGNIDKKWTNEDVMKLLQEIGIEKIDTVTVMTDPSNAGRNRGFAFVELETHKDAQIAFKKLQKKDVGKLQNMKVAWAEPLSEPDEEELLKVKSVYAEYLPPSWGEEKLRSYFAKFGEIENIVLSRNLHSSKRKDFAFINFKAREAALACIESFNHEALTDEGSQVNVKVSLAKPIPKGKPQKRVSKPATKGIPKQTHTTQYPVKPIELRNKEIPAMHINSQRTDDSRSPGTSDLEQRLAERALQKQMQARLGTGITNRAYSQALPGQKRSFSALGDDLSYSDLRGQTRSRMGSSFPVGSLSRGEVLPGAGVVPHSYYQRRSDYGADHRYTDYANSFQREEPPYRGTGRDYHRY